MAYGKKSKQKKGKGYTADAECAPGDMAPEAAPGYNGKFEVPYSNAYFEDKNHTPHKNYFYPIDGDEPDEN